MPQTSQGVRGILSNPFIYSFFQLLMGAHKLRQNFVETLVKPFEGMKVLDVGCGPADILAYFPTVEYWGFDISKAYINQAQSRFCNRGRFQCKQLQHTDLPKLPAYDVVLALGLLHHLDDSVAIEIMQIASNALKEGGRLLTIDPCLDPSQNRIARFLVCKDRGRNVRDKDGYESLAKTVFESPRIEVRQQKWIPYTHCFIECRK
ncbi:MAG: hypothetical protein VR65_07980 [Desulfobulbaceae bacterium BRH_c16a]|nr:MAG: hypothetical protein VR65_07980 [Desulfobulbaceae bacterium BRH_c16a]